MAVDRPERVVLTDIATNEYITAQFNPDEVAEKLAVNWARMKMLGQGQQELQYENTENLQIDFELGFDALSLNEGGRFDLSGASGIESARRWLHSLCYARREAASIDDGGAAQVLLVWPNLYALVTVIRSLEFSHKRFAWTMESTLFSAKVALEENCTFRLTREDVLAYGTLRAG